MNGAERSAHSRRLYEQMLRDKNKSVDQINEELRPRSTTNRPPLPLREYVPDPCPVEPRKVRVRYAQHELWWMKD